MVNKVRK